ncbi:MAG: hypothetical protein M1834_008090 [Cirrosporium novae-zelandiae]|nr:MAG: hypothetical protein M1834_008090 [Cirrosporium novae-zelandiae]
MSSSLANKVALVTGGTKGIGRAIVLRLAKSGSLISFVYSRDTSAAESLVNEIGKDRCLAIQADAASISGIEKIVKETVNKFGKIDALIPCAGIMAMKDLESTTEADWDQTMNLNVKGPYFLAQKAAPHMSDGSHIVFFSTTLCVINNPLPPNYLLYVTSKGAVEQMTRVMSKDLARRGICVNSIAPGPTGTDLFFEGKSEQVLKMIASINPRNRIGTPEEQADVVAFLASDESRWVTGQTLRVNGGQA